MFERAKRGPAGCLSTTIGFYHSEEQLRIVNYDFLSPYIIN